jgi:hypothetical protein
MPRLLFARCKMIVLEMIGDFSDQEGKSKCSGRRLNCLTIERSVSLSRTEKLFVSLATRMPYSFDPNQRKKFLSFFNLSDMKFYKFLMLRVYLLRLFGHIQGFETNCSRFTQGA